MITADSEPLLAALEGLGEHVGRLRLPLEVADIGAARRLHREITDQLEDYVLPRLRRLDAPLLAVVGGPTGAGKSTLVNSLVASRISAASALRPTTRSAVLAHHPGDVDWFNAPRILPGLNRTTHSTADPRSIQLVASTEIPTGLAVLDAPDIDSVVTSNRTLATELLAAADMWMFVTTAARYADAVPWEFLRSAVTRGTAVALVLDRVPRAAVDEVRGHLATMLTEQGLGGSPLFVVPETTPYEGLLPREVVDPLRTWLHGLASNGSVREAVVRHTLDGAIASLAGRVFELAAAADAQADAEARLRRAVDQAYDVAVERVDEASGDGSLLRGEVLARWQEYVATGELMSSLETKAGRLRDGTGAAGRGKPKPGSDLAEALTTGVQALVCAAADEAAGRAGSAWRADPAGTALLEGEEDLERSSGHLAEHTARAVREWQDLVLDLVREESQGKQATAHHPALGVNGLGLLVMIVVFAHNDGPVAGEVAVAGEAAALSQKILEAALGAASVPGVAATARTDLHRRVAELIEAERSRFTARLDRAAVDEQAGAALRAVVQDIEDAR